MSAFSDGSNKIVEYVKKHPWVLYALVGVLVFYYIYKKYVGSSASSSGTVSYSAAPAFDPQQAQYALQAQQLQDQNNLAMAQLNLQSQQLSDQLVATNNATNAAAETNYMSAQGQQLASIAGVINATVTPLLQFGAGTINGIQQTNQQTLAAAALLSSNQMTSANNAIGSVAAALGAQGAAAENALTQAGIGAAQTAQQIVRSNAQITGDMINLAGTALMMA